MRFVLKIKGFRNDFKRNEMFKKTNFQVNYTSDFMGKTLSISDLENEVQYSIPFDEILKMINRR